MITAPLIVAVLLLCYSLALLMKIEKISGFRTGMLLLGNASLVLYLASKVLALLGDISLFSALHQELLLLFTSACFLVSVLSFRR